MRPREIYDLLKITLIDKGSPELTPKSHLTTWKNEKERY